MRGGATGRSPCAEHDRQASGLRRWCFCGNEGRPIRRPSGRSQAAQLRRPLGIQAVSCAFLASRTTPGSSRLTRVPITRAELVLESAAPPDPQDARERMARRSRSRSSSPATRPRGRRPPLNTPADVATPHPPTSEANVQAPIGQFPRHTADDVLGAWRLRGSGANQGALFRLTGIARGPIVAPRNTPTVPTLQQPDPRKLLKCSEILDSSEWAIQDSNLGPLPYQENLLSPPVVPNSNLIPANACNSMIGRRLDDWALQPGGPIVAPRPRFEGRVSYGPEADIMPTIRSSPDAREAGRCAPA